jgi:prepilin-type N-terminal cleavage/methylation domain-containing protein
MRLDRVRPGFTLIELVIVVVIVGIIAAIAIPRFTSAGASATDAAVAGDLEALRKAIEVYHGEHLGTYPTLTGITAQLTQYSDIQGNVSATRGGKYIYGPYLRAIPPLRVGPAAGATGIAAAPGPGVGWVYDQGTGKINAATDNPDRRGKGYDEY